MKSEAAEFAEFQPFADKDGPLRDDIRLLGAILGDTIRDQEGEAVFAIVEEIRRTSVRFHKSRDPKDGAQLTEILSRLSAGEAALVVRSFSYFSHLANIAEDAHHPPPHPGARHRRLQAPHRHDAPRARRRQGGRHHPRRAADLLRGRVHLAGADRASHRSAPALDAGLGVGRRPAARLLQRPRPAGGRARADRPDDPRGGAVAVADQPAAAAQAHRDRRGRQRFDLLQLFHAVRASQPLHAAGERGRGVRSRGSGAGDPLVPAHGQLDRRRPRRQPVRQGRRARRDGADARRQDHEALRRRADPAAPRADAVGKHHHHLARPEAPGRHRQRRPRAAAERALPPRTQRPHAEDPRDASTPSRTSRNRIGRPTPSPPSSGPTWRSSEARSATTAPPSSPGVGCSACCAPSTASASTWPRSTCGRTRRCTSVPWPN